MCFTICATIIIIRAAEARSTASAPKSTGVGPTWASAWFAAARKARRCAGWAGSSSSGITPRIALCNCEALSRKCGSAIETPCAMTPARARISALAVASSTASTIALSSAASSVEASGKAASRSPTSASEKACSASIEGWLFKGGQSAS
jgi:hypothetical protein